MAPIRVLFVEDDELIREFIAHELTALGYDVTEAETGDQAAQLLEGKVFDILLTDVRMPGKLDGIDLAHHARRRRPGFPVLVVSGFAEQISTRLTSLRPPMTFLAKPFALEQLLRSLTGLKPA